MASRQSYRAGGSLRGKRLDAGQSQAVSRGTLMERAKMLAGADDKALTQDSQRQLIVCAAASMIHTLDFWYRLAAHGIGEPSSLHLPNDQYVIYLYYFN